MSLISNTWEALNAQAEWLFLAGMVLVAIWNIRLWRRDKALLQHLQAIKPETPILNSTPRVSILVAAWNEAQMIDAHIQSFLSLRYPERELILCAGGNDGTFELATKYAGDQVIILKQQPGQGKQWALRECLKHASGEVVFLTDADCLLSDDAFERTLAPIINDNQVAATGGSKPLVNQMNSSFVAFQAAIDGFSLIKAPDPSPGLLGRNCAVRMDILKVTGGFDTDALSGTDYTLARQLLTNGYSIRNVKYSLMETVYPADWRVYFHKRTRWLRNIIVIGMQSRDYSEALRGIRSSLVALLFMLMPFLGFIWGSIVFIAWILVLAHGILSRIRYVVLHDYPANISKITVAASGVISLLFDVAVWSAALFQSLMPALRSWK